MKVDAHSARFVVDTSLQLPEDVDPNQLNRYDLPWLHERVNDDDPDNDLLTGISYVYRNIIHEIIDFSLPELTELEYFLFGNNKEGAATPFGRGLDEFSDNTFDNYCPNIIEVEDYNLTRICSKVKSTLYKNKKSKPIKFDYKDPLKLINKGKSNNKLLPKSSNNQNNVDSIWTKLNTFNTNKTKEISSLYNNNTNGINAWKSLNDEREDITRKNYEEYTKKITDFLEDFKEYQYKYRGGGAGMFHDGTCLVNYDNHCWESRIPPEEGEEKRTNLAKYCGTNEHLLEGIANHSGGRGLDGEFTITPWMEDYIHKAIDEGYVGWDGIAPMTTEVFEKGKKRAEFIWNASIQGGKSLKSTQALYAVVGQTYAEDSWMDGTPKIINVSEAEGRSTNKSTAGACNAGEGWCGATGYSAKVQAAKIAGIAPVPPAESYTSDNHQILRWRSDEEWAKIVLAYIWRWGKDAIEPMFECEPKNDEELEDIACVGFAFKAGMGYKKAQAEGLPKYRYKFVAADIAYLDFNGNGLIGAMGWITAWALGKYAGKDKMDIKDIKKQLNDRFHIPDKIAKRWASNSNKG